ncbi:MAG: hypothetical protein V4622_06915 [Bacteroidota bacterium]
MKYTSLFIFLFLLTSVNKIIAQKSTYKDKTFPTVETKSEFVLYLAKNYNPNGFDILSYAKKPKKYTHYIGGSTHTNVLFSYNTVIHEACHHANAEMGSFVNGITYDGIFITPEIKISVPERAVYKSNELLKIVPKEQQDKIFRFKTYVEGKTDGGVKIPFLRSVNEGIYGLLDEFCAYHQGLRANLELYGYYKTFCTDDDYELLIKYIQSSSSDVFAYHEFRLFIAWYLKYAKENHPDVYKDCIENKNLKVAFTLIDMHYKKAVDDYSRIRAEIVKNINDSKKTSATINENGFIAIPNSSNGFTSWGGPEKDNKYLLSLMTEECQAMLDLILIKELNTENYKDFLEK